MSRANLCWPARDRARRVASTLCVTQEALQIRNPSGERGDLRGGAVSQ